jgi:hypothetical protein
VNPHQRYPGGLRAISRYVAWGGSEFRSSEESRSKRSASKSWLVHACAAARSPVGLSWLGRSACSSGGWCSTRNIGALVAHARPLANSVSASCGRGKHGWLALAKASHNKAVETDAQGRPRAARAPFLGRRSLLR